MTTAVLDEDVIYEECPRCKGLGIDPDSTEHEVFPCPQCSLAGYIPHGCSGEDQLGEYEGWDDILEEN